MFIIRRRRGEVVYLFVCVVDGWVGSCMVGLITVRAQITIRSVLRRFV